MKLFVLAGAKQGAEIPLKKDKFTIGRASDCTLRAGSDAISRHHCLLLRSDQRVTVRDLGSRNGTYVNDIRIEKETPLEHGDELRVGPLHFKFHNDNADKQSKPPKVKSVADAVVRSASMSDDPASEDDISRWLLGPDPGNRALVETQSFKLDETRAIATASEGRTNAGGDANAETISSESAASGKLGESKDKGKPKPGKLPPVPKQMAKDSREAAADVLREMARRR
jgi:pSer/pThr/pTyr-binding forkhead associated (FHA) protein